MRAVHFKAWRDAAKQPTPNGRLAGHVSASFPYGGRAVRHGSMKWEGHARHWAELPVIRSLLMIEGKSGLMVYYGPLLD